MGNSESQPDDEHYLDKFDGIETLGYRVLGVQPDSPASAAGLVSFFDFLVGANGRMLLGSGEELKEGDEYDDVDLPALLHEFLGKPLELLVFNIKSQQERLVTITPSNDWDGAGLLGVTIRLDNYGGADERLVRVLTVERNSPAAIAGLVPMQDYLLGTTTESFEDTSILSDVLYMHTDRVVELYVYNTDSDVVRIVALMPTWSWGGKGLLGAEVGTGYLHRLPRHCRNTPGSSVERKVKWTTNTTSTYDSSGGNQHSDMLRMEPQLEMEPDPHHEQQQQDEVRVTISAEGAIGVAKETAPLAFQPSAATNKERAAAPPPPEQTPSAPPPQPPPEQTPSAPPPPQVPEQTASAPPPPTPEQTASAAPPPPAPEQAASAPPPPAPEQTTSAPPPPPEQTASAPPPPPEQTTAAPPPPLPEQTTSSAPPIQAVPPLPPQAPMEPTKSAEEVFAAPPPAGAPPPPAAAKQVPVTTTTYAAPTPPVLHEAGTAAEATSQPTAASFASTFMPPPPLSHLSRQ